jgi:nitrogen fixation NifU-like protein
MGDDAMTTTTAERDFAGEGIYRENILDHYKHPHHFGKLAKCDVSHTELNPVCGDTLTFYLRFSADGKVSDARFEGKGCAISMASASMLADELVGKTREELQRMDRHTILDLLGIELGPVRLKCAMLSLDTLKNALLIHSKYTGGKK